MKPMISYMGGKHRLSAKMLPPQHDQVIEPFAGGAGYSLRWEPKEVLLIEKNPKIAAVWRYLISASKQEILSLPLDFDHVDDLDVCDGAKWFIGLKIVQGVAYPSPRRYSWGNKKNISSASYWNERGRKRVADQLHKIRHWEIFEGSYEEAPDVEAHWVVDPPYHTSGHKYPGTNMDYEHLAEWCMTRKGYAVVHETEGAVWLPFNNFHVTNAMNGNNRSGVSSEVIWENWARPVRQRTRKPKELHGGD